MKEAFAAMYDEAKFDDIGLEIASREKDDRFSIIRPSIVHTRDYSIANGLEQRKALLGLPSAADMASGRAMALAPQASHPALVHSLVSGQTTTVDLAKLYSSPPADLKDFLPTAWDTRPVYFSGAGDAGFRNYFRGRPIAWDTAKFAPYLPDVAAAPDTVAAAARIIGQSWGGRKLAMPLHLVLQ
jgi:hypothetical protein